MKARLILIFLIIVLQSCKTQQLQTTTTLPKVENQLTGELDYTKEGFELVQWQKSGDQISLGRIDKTGKIHFSMPEYDIKALGRNHMEHEFETQLNMLRCKKNGEFDRMGRPLFKTPYEDVYSQCYPPLYLRKYGVNIAYIAPASDEEMIAKGNFNKVIGDKYYWMYIDRALDFRDTCIRETFQDPDLEIERIADIQFKKGWNFIKSSLVELQNYGKNNEKIMAKKILYTQSSPDSKDVKWYMVRAMDDAKILAAKKEYELQNQ